MLHDACPAQLHVHFPHQTQPNPYEDSLCQETDSPSERFFAFFSAFQGRAQSTVGRMSCRDCCAQVHAKGLPHTLIEALSPAQASAEKSPYGPLRPRKHAGPSYRPLPQGGGPGIVRQCEPGAGERQPPATVDDARRLDKSQSGDPSNRQGAGRRATVLRRVL
jgi:hypothetical protein